MKYDRYHPNSVILLLLPSRSFSSQKWICEAFEILSAKLLLISILKMSHWWRYPENKHVERSRVFFRIFDKYYLFVQFSSISSLSEIDVNRKLRFNWICYNKNNFVTSNLFSENVRGIWKCSRSTVWTCSIVKFLFTQHWNWWYCQFHFF